MESDSRSLVLLDELGTGTDPTEGSALAAALLSRLVCFPKFCPGTRLLFKTTQLVVTKDFDLVPQCPHTYGPIFQRTARSDRGIFRYKEALAARRLL